MQPDQSFPPVIFLARFAMQIKCPGCASVLNIPESAAGKVVKCPCGKQLRAPGGGGAQTAASPQGQRPAQPTPQRPAQPTPQRPAQPTPQRPAQPTQRAAPQRPAQPAPQRPAAARPVAAQPAAGGFGGDIFDELTESDFKGLTPQNQPGKAKRSVHMSAMDEVEHREQGPLTIGLVLMAIFNALVAMLIGGVFLNLFMKIPSGALNTAGIIFFSIETIAIIILVGSIVLCFVRGEGSWFGQLFCVGMYAAHQIRDIAFVTMIQNDIGFNAVNFDTSKFTAVYIVRGSILAVLIAELIYLHFKPPRKFYGVSPGAIKMTAVPMLLGAVVAVIGAVVIYLLRPS
jgi:ribosomal protein S27E